MQSNRKILSLISTLLFLATSAHGKSLEIGFVEALGPGCPEGTYSIKYADGQATSINFTDFTVNTTLDQPNDHKRCVIKLHLLVPPGFRVGINQATATANATVYEQTQASVSIDYKYAGETNPISASENLQRAEGELHTQVSALGEKWSACGNEGEAILKIGVTLLATSPGEKPLTTASVLNAELPHFTYKRCN